MTMVIGLSAARAWLANKSIDLATIAAVRYRIQPPNAVIASEAKQSIVRQKKEWIASSLRSLQ
jgi:hypothetical protein